MAWPNLYLTGFFSHPICTGGFLFFCILYFTFSPLTFHPWSFLTWSHGKSCFGHHIDFLFLTCSISYLLSACLWNRPLHGSSLAMEYHLPFGKMVGVLQIPSRLIRRPKTPLWATPMETAMLRHYWLSSIGIASLYILSFSSWIWIFVFTLNLSTWWW